ncbi:hypothetical protein MUP29_03490 [bacterium]|nr:hypothetical protein [bacterium]
MKGIKGIRSNSFQGGKGSLTQRRGAAKKGKNWGETAGPLKEDFLHFNKAGSLKGNYDMNKSAKFILSIVVLAVWSYLTLFISKEVQIDRCVDVGGYWEQNQNECIYVDKNSALFLIKLYETKIIIETEDRLKRDLRDRLKRQFNIELSDASLLLHVYNILSSSDSLSPQVLEEVKSLLAGKE